MSRPKVLDFHSFDKNIIESKIKIGHPETRNAIIMIPITTSLLFKTPKMYMPFKPKIQNKIGGYVRLAFDNIKIDKEVNDFFIFINSIDEYLEHELLKTKIMNNKNIKYFQKTIKQTDGFSDYFNMNFNISEIKVYDSTLKPINILDVEGNFYAHFIIELNGIYFNKQTKKMRVIWNLVQFKLDKIKNIIDECLFLDEENIENDKKNSNLNNNIANISNKPKEIMVMKDNEILSKFFKMLSIGIPKQAVQHKMTLMNLDIRFLDYTSDFNIYDLPNDLKNILIPESNNQTITNNNISIIHDDKTLINPVSTLFSSVNQFNKTKLKKINPDSKANKFKNQLKIMKKTIPVPTLEEIQEARNKLFGKKTNNK